MDSYKELEVWQRAVELVEALYLVTADFPKSELFGITSQIRRASVAIPSNIAEGYGRGHRAEYVHFLRISYSSALEVETQLILAQRIGYLSNDQLIGVNEKLLSTIMMLKALIRSLK